MVPEGAVGEPGDVVAVGAEGAPGVAVVVGADGVPGCGVAVGELEELPLIISQAFTIPCHAPEKKAPVAATIASPGPIVLPEDP